MTLVKMMEVVLVNLVAAMARSGGWWSMRRRRWKRRWKWRCKRRWK
jgi:hypothetical protein